MRQCAWHCEGQPSPHPDPLLRGEGESSADFQHYPSPQNVFMSARRVVVVGGGAAGFFGAIRCAEAMPQAEVSILERGAHFLSKVRISGGGRCNVTHACFDARESSTAY